MKHQNDLKRPKDPKTAEPAPKKRFRLEKLEERIAPTPHYNPHTKLVGGGNGGGGGGTSSGSLSGGTIY